MTTTRDPLTGATYVDGRGQVNVIDPDYPADRAVFRQIIQATNQPVGGPTSGYLCSLEAIDMATASLVLVTDAGAVTISGQLSFDGVTNLAPAAITLFNAVAAGTYMLALRDVLVDGSSNAIWAPRLNCSLTVATAASDIDFYLMAQGK